MNGQILKTTIGVIIAGTILIGMYFLISTVISNNNSINQVVSFLNNAAKSQPQPSTTSIPSH